MLFSELKELYSQRMKCLEELDLFSNYKYNTPTLEYIVGDRHYTRERLMQHLTNVYEKMNKIDLEIKDINKSLDFAIGELILEINVE